MQGKRRTDGFTTWSVKKVAVLILSLPTVDSACSASLRSRGEDPHPVVTPETEGLRR